MEASFLTTAQLAALATDASDARSPDPSPAHARPRGGQGPVSPPAALSRQSSSVKTGTSSSRQRRSASKIERGRDPALALAGDQASVGTSEQPSSRLSTALSSDVYAASQEVRVATPDGTGHEERFEDLRHELEGSAWAPHSDRPAVPKSILQDALGLATTKRSRATHDGIRTEFAVPPPLPPPTLTDASPRRMHSSAVPVVRPEDAGLASLREMARSLPVPAPRDDFVTATAPVAAPATAPAPRPVIPAGSALSLEGWDYIRALQAGTVAPGATSAATPRPSVGHGPPKFQTPEAPPPSGADPDISSIMARALALAQPRSVRSPKEPLPQAPPAPSPLKHSTSVGPAPPAAAPVRISALHLSLSSSAEGVRPPRKPTDPTSASGRSPASPGSIPHPAPPASPSSPSGRPGVTRRELPSAPVEATEPTEAAGAAEAVETAMLSATKRQSREELTMPSRGRIHVRTEEGEVRIPGAGIGAGARLPPRTSPGTSPRGTPPEQQTPAVVRSPHQDSPVSLLKKGTRTTAPFPSPASSSAQGAQAAAPSLDGRTSVSSVAPVPIVRRRPPSPGDGERRIPRLPRPTVVEIVEPEAPRSATGRPRVYPPTAVQAWGPQDPQRDPQGPSPGEAPARRVPTTSPRERQEKKAKDRSRSRSPQRTRSDTPPRALRNAAKDLAARAAAVGLTEADLRAAVSSAAGPALRAARSVGTASACSDRMSDYAVPPTPDGAPQCPRQTPTPLFVQPRRRVTKTAERGASIAEAKATFARHMSDMSRSSSAREGSLRPDHLTSQDTDDGAPFADPAATGRPPGFRDVSAAFAGSTPATPRSADPVLPITPQGSDVARRVARAPTKAAPVVGSQPPSSSGRLLSHAGTEVYRSAPLSPAVSSSAPALSGDSSQVEAPAAAAQASPVVVEDHTARTPEARPVAPRSASGDSLGAPPAVTNASFFSAHGVAPSSPGTPGMGGTSGFLLTSDDLAQHTGMSAPGSPSPAPLIQLHYVGSPAPSTMSLGRAPSDPPPRPAIGIVSPSSPSHDRHAAAIAAVMQRNGFRMPSATYTSPLHKR